jgi:hypothetical protein
VPDHSLYASTLDRRKFQFLVVRNHTIAISFSDADFGRLVDTGFFLAENRDCPKKGLDDFCGDWNYSDSALRLVWVNLIRV